jgi:hypothetical protein
MTARILTAIIAASPILALWAMAAICERRAR